MAKSKELAGRLHHSSRNGMAIFESDVIVIYGFVCQTSSTIPYRAPLPAKQIIKYFGTAISVRIAQ